jgi:L-iditol 2-dehydrogenase
VHGVDGSTGRRKPPLILGHEAAGEVVETGTRVTHFRPGDRVFIDSTVYCGACRNCLRGRTNMCATAQVLGCAPVKEEWSRHGCFAQYTAVPERIAHNLPDNVSFHRAALIEPLAVGRHAIALTEIPDDKPVVVVGTGLVGLSLIAQLRADGYEVIAINRGAERLKPAIALGATGLLMGSERLVEQVMDLTGGGPEAVFEAVGEQDTISLAHRLLTVPGGGQLTILGNVSKTASMPVQTTTTRQVRIQGSRAFPMSCVAPCIRLLEEGRVQVDSWITATCDLPGAADWLLRLNQGTARAIKVIVEPNGGIQ